MKEKSRIHNGYTQFVKLIIFKDGNCYLKWDWNKMAPQFNPPPVEFIGAIPKEQAKRAYPNVPLRDWDNQHLSKDDRRLVERTETLIEFLKNPTIKLSDWPSNIKDTSSCMGVGDGTGKLFVYGNHESIIAARNIILERDELRKQLKDITVSNHPVKDTPYVEWLDKRVEMKIRDPNLNDRHSEPEIAEESKAQMQQKINHMTASIKFLLQERKYYIDLLTEQAERTKLQREGTTYGTPFDESLPHLDRLKLDYLKSKETAGQDFLFGIQDIESIKEMFRNPANHRAFNPLFFPIFFDTRGNPILPAASITADENASQETKNALAEMINIASKTVEDDEPKEK